jgi:hypothetical protein
VVSQGEESTPGPNPQGESARIRRCECIRRSGSAGKSHPGQNQRRASMCIRRYAHARLRYSDNRLHHSERPLHCSASTLLGNEMEVDEEVAELRDASERLCVGGGLLVGCGRRGCGGSLWDVRLGVRFDGDLIFSGCLMQKEECVVLKSRLISSLGMPPSHIIACMQSQSFPRPSRPPRSPAPSVRLTYTVVL